MKMISVIAASFIALLSAPIVSTASCVENCVTKITTDFKGRPPFKRRVETLSATDVAQVEVKEIGKLAEVRTIDFRGPPPFKRRTELLPIADIAEVELFAEEEQPKRPSRAGGSSMLKRH
jgi:hypothetical protein